MAIDTCRGCSTCTRHVAQNLLIPCKLIISHSQTEYVEDKLATLELFDTVRDQKPKTCETTFSQDEPDETQQASIFSYGEARLLLEIH